MEGIATSRVYQVDPIPYRSVQVQMAQTKYLREIDSILKDEKKYKIIYNILYIIINILVLILTILSFLVTTELFNRDTKQWINLTIGILGIITTSAHNILNGNQYQGKNMLCKIIHKQYDRMLVNLNSNNNVLETTEIEHTLIQQYAIMV